MNWTEIITAAIAAGGAVAGSAIMQSKTVAILHTKLEALREEVRALSLRVDKHNQLQDRILRAECKLETLEREVEHK